MKRSHEGYDIVKRGLDIVAAALALVVASPVLLVVALLVRAKLGSPVLFRQKRPGKDGRPFTILKFRTMLPAPEGTAAAEAVATDAARLTRFGASLRASSLDELPELLNVLTGDMSVVGPRPLLPEYLERYTDEQARRHEVRPGITGWAQVNGRNAVSWDDRLAMDVWYVENRSFALDARIALKTVAAVLERRDISAEGEATMRPFEPDADMPSTKEGS